MSQLPCWIGRLMFAAAAAAMSLTVAIGAEPEFKPAPLTAPEGYTVELAAAPPLVAHPLMGALDPQGRLYLAATAGENLRRPDLEARLPNFVQRLEDVDGDGVFDKATVFADQMTFPQGCLWHRGSLYVASSGAIWRLTDDDDDGVADRREKLVDGFNYGGNAADVHGCFLGPEGRIYWCDGRWGHEISDADGKLVSRGKAAHIFSCRPDGSDVRSHCTGGMDNPVEIVFNPAGDMFGTVNLMYSKPRGDCLVHWQYGGVYPREDFASSLDAELLRTGDLLTEVHNLGHVAVSGLCRLATNPLDPRPADELLISVFNTNRIVRMDLAPDGSSYKAEMIEDFVVSSSRDFHPTDVLQDADGSILVIDTGGWFRIGCPQSQIAKSDIHGAIYRIRKQGAATPDDPRGRQIAWEKLTNEQMLALLSDQRPAVIEQAQRQLEDRIAAQGDPLIEQIFLGWKDFPIVARQRLLCVGVASGSRRAGPLMLAGLLDQSPSVRQTACRCLYDADTINQVAIHGELLRLLEDPAPSVRREAAAALGLRGEAAAALDDRPTSKKTTIAALLAALPANLDDPLVRHAMVYALIDLGDREAIAAGLLSPHPGVRTATAIALEQLRQKNAAPDEWLAIPAPATGAELTDDEQQRILQRAQTMPAGDPERGRELFFHARSSCSKCHRVGEQGGMVGPDLSTIGRIRGLEDLLASMLYPSASFARGFESYRVLTTDGLQKNGIILAENSREIRLGIDKDNAVSIAVGQIEEIVPSPLSIMPQDIVKQLSPQDLADLIAYMQSCK